MNRYLVFAFNSYYPSGGMEDFKGDFNTLSEAMEYLCNLLSKEIFDSWHIYDADKKEIVKRGEKN